MKKQIRIGMIGSGFAADLHAKSYAQVHGCEVVLRAVASLDDGLEAFAARFGFERTCRDYHELLADPEIDIIDIIAPPYLHASMVTDALRSGKHVICEKPLIGYFGLPGYETAGGDSKAHMLENVRAQLAALRTEVEQAQGLFMYAENFIYAPAVQRSLQMMEAEQSRILFMRAEESHSGSHAGHAAAWKYSGGGAFIRQGCHPLSAVLYLKRRQAEYLGEQPPKVVSVVADVGVAAACLSEEEHRYIQSHPVDVEDIANVLLTFSDGTKAIVMAGDMVVGGVRNLVEIYTNKSVHHCNLAPNSGMIVYHEDNQGLEQVYFTEKLGNKTGWQPVFLEEERMRGYIDELQDFVECAAENRSPHSDFDLACDTTELIYAAYLSAAEGRRVMLP